MDAQQPIRDCPKCNRKVPTRIASCRCGYQFDVGPVDPTAPEPRTSLAGASNGVAAVHRGLTYLRSLIPSDRRSVAFLLLVGLTLGVLGEHWRMAAANKEVIAASARRSLGARLDGFNRGWALGQVEYEKRIKPALIDLQIQCNQAAATSQIADALQWMAAIQDADRRDRIWNEIVSGR